MIGEIERDAAVALAEPLEPHPHHLARRHQRVEHRRAVVGDARREDVAFQHRGRHRGALELLDRVEQRLEAAPLRPDPLPRHHETAERIGLDRLDLLAQFCQRAPAQAPEHVRLHPLALGAARPELAFDEAPGFREPLQQRPRHRHTQPIACCQLRHGEGAVRAGETHGEVASGVAHRLEQGLGQPRREGCAQRIAVARHVLHRDVARLAGHRQSDQTPCPHELGYGLCGAGKGRALDDLIEGEIADANQQVVDGVGAARLVAVFQVLQAPLELGERVRIQQVAKFGVAQQFAQLRLIDRQRLRAPLGQRRVAVVDVVGDIAEEERRRKR